MRTDRRSGGVLAVFGAVALWHLVSAHSDRLVGAANVRAAAPTHDRGVLAQEAFRLEAAGHIGGSATAVAVEGTYAYVGVGPRPVVLDVVDPGAPRVVAQSSPMPGVVRGIAVSAGHVYVAAGNAGVRVIDVTNPQAPAEVGSLETGQAEVMRVDGGHAYVPGSNPLRQTGRW